MRINLTQIMKATNCNEEQALNVERYIDQGDMLDWSEASKQMINTIARAVNDKLLRDAPVKKAKIKVKVTKAKARRKTPIQAPVKAKPAGPTPGTKIAHAMVIYKAMFEGDTTPSRQDVISALEHSMQITRQQAAGYYQNCKKKVA